MLARSLARRRTASSGGRQEGVRSPDLAGVQGESGEHCPLSAGRPARPSVRRAHPLSSLTQPHARAAAPRRSAAVPRRARAGCAAVHGAHARSSLAEGLGARCTLLAVGGTAVSRDRASLTPWRPRSWPPRSRATARWWRLSSATTVCARSTRRRLLPLRRGCELRRRADEGRWPAPCSPTARSPRRPRSLKRWRSCSSSTRYCLLACGGWVPL
jgi:hypothetical protein